MEVAIVAGLMVGALCGFINGLLIVKFKELSAVIVTIATMIIYRGMSLLPRTALWQFRLVSLAGAKLRASLYS